jgi:heme exporter protein D
MGRHLAFVVVSYAVTTLVLAGLIVWAILDHRTQGRRLSDLESRGAGRRPRRG